MERCFFIGHRDAPEALLDPLREAVARHVAEYGVREFVVGHYRRFDALAARAVREQKERCPDLRLVLLLPYHPALRPVPQKAGYDELFYPPGMETVPPKAAIPRANRYMVDHSRYLIAYAWHPASSARDLLEYAQRRGKAVTLLPRVLGR